MMKRVADYISPLLLIRYTKNQVGNKTLLAPTLDPRGTEAIYTLKKLVHQKRNVKFGKDSFLSKYDLFS